MDDSILRICGYCRISVDEELDRENTSIEHQRSIIEDYVKKKFPNAALDFYEDRDRSGYTFEQREGYMQARPRLMDGTYQILLVKDFSRFSRRNSKGLVELEDLRDAGLRMIAIGDAIDYPTYDDWMNIQIRFLMNEMPVTDTSKKVKSVIGMRQSEGRWICSVPYGYIITNSKTMAFEVDEAAADVVRKVFELYNSGWGYKKIANYLTDQNIPTPRMCEKLRKEAKGEAYKVKCKREWSIVTVSTILTNDFYIGTLRQSKYRRKKINGKDMKNDESQHIVFEKNHEAIVDYKTFAITQEQLKKRSNTHYRGIKKYDNVYSGFLFCGDCKSPMFSMSRKDLKPAYTCGSYHARGLKGCTSHHTRVDTLDSLLKAYIAKVRDNSASMLEKLNASLKNEMQVVKENTNTLDLLQSQIDDAQAEMKILVRQQAKEIMKNPDKESVIEEIYQEMLEELSARIAGLKHQMELTSDRRNTIIRVNRIAKTAIDIFDDVLKKEKLSKMDLELIIDKIIVFEDHIDIKLKADIDSILKTGWLRENAENFQHDTKDISLTHIIQSATHKADKVLSVNVISEGDPLEIYTDNDGEVIFKKYSPIGELASFASQYAEVLSKIAGYPVVVCDRDHVISVAGIPKKELIERRVSPSLEELMEQRRNYAFSEAAEKLQPVEGVERFALVQSPIIASGDVCGSIMFIAGEGQQAATDTEIKLIQVGSAFLGRQMEE